MKKFLYKFGIFILITTTCAWLLQALVDFGLKRMSAYSSSQTSISELLSDTLNGDILIMGNSRALCSYNCQIMETATGKRIWNIGVSGQPFGISYMRYHLYKQHNNSPKLVVINIDQGELDMIDNGFGQEEYYPYMSDSIIQSYFDLYGFSWKHIYIPMYKYFGNFKLIGYGLSSCVGLYPFPANHHYHGFYNANHDFEGANLRKTLQKDSIIKADCNPQAVALLDSFLLELSKENIKVIFCYAPQYQLLYQKISLDSMMNAYTELSEKYSIPILNYSSVSWSDDSTYFYNANHINLRGSKIFSTDLSCEIKHLYCNKTIDF